MTIKNKNLKNYEALLELIEVELQQGRLLTHKRMFFVFLWSFFFPALTLILFILMNKFKVLPQLVRMNFDWILLSFPVGYAIFYLLFEALKDLPMWFKKGGYFLALRQNLKESQWRSDFNSKVILLFKDQKIDWQWMIHSFRADLRRMRNQTRHLTIIAAATFFFVFEGMNFFIEEPKASMSPTPHTLFQYFDHFSQNSIQLFTFILFFALLYQASLQVVYSLERYLDCLILLEQENKSAPQITGPK